MTPPDIDSDKISLLNDNIGELQIWVRALLEALIKGDKEAMERQMELTALLEGIILGLNLIAKPLREFRDEQMARDTAHASIEAQQARLVTALETMNKRLDNMEARSMRQEQQMAQLIRLLG